ncbi:MAG: hypothetical protein ACRC62_35655 [Microcoleus sp.]
MIVNLLPEITGFTDLINSDAATHLLVVKLHLSSPILAQDYSIFTNFQKAWNNFVSTGQIGAFVIGIGIGWFIKGIMP